MIKILKCTIPESNSRPLDLQSDALPVEPSTNILIHHLKNCIGVNSKAINFKNRYFNCQFAANSIGTKYNPNWRFVLKKNSASCVVSEKICGQTLQTI